MANKKQAQLQEIINHSPAVAFVWRAAAEWPVEFVSDNVRRFGYTPEDFYSGRVSYINIVHPDDLERADAEVAQYSREPGRTEFAQEYRIVTPAGEVCWTDSRVWIRRDANDNITHYQGVVLDVTARKQAEVERIRLLVEPEMRVRELNCLNDIGRKIDETPPVPELLEWVTGRIPPAMQYPEVCVAAIEFEDQVYGAAEAVNLPHQVVQGLYTDGELVGRIYVAYTEEYGFLDEESALLGDISRRVSGYIESRRLFEKTQAMLDETQSLYRIAQITASAEDMPEFYAAIHSIVGELMYAQNFYIALYDESTQLLTFPYFVDEYDAMPQPRKLGRGMTDRIIHTGQPLLVSQETYKEWIQRGELEPVGTWSVDWLGVPLKSGEKTYGALVVQSYTEDVRIGEQEEELLTFVSQQIATAVERKQAETERARLLDELETRERFSAAVAQITSDLLRRGVAAIQDSLARLGQTAQVSRVYIYENFVDEQDGLCMRQTHEWVATGITPQIDNPQLQRVPYSAGFERWREVLARGDIVQGVVQDFPASEQAILVEQDILSMLVIPVFLEQEFYGFIGFADCGSERGWRQAEIELLQAAAAASGSAIRGARLFASIEAQVAARTRQLAEFAALVENATDAIAMRNLDGELIYANRSMYELLGYDQSSEQLLGTTVADIFAPEAIERARFEVLPATRTTGWRGDLAMKRRDGRQFIARLASFGIRDPQGRLLSLAAILRDATEEVTRYELRTRQVQIATEIAQEIAAAPALDVIYQRVVILVKERFHYYHAQVFRYSPEDDAMVLIEGYGDAGKRMKAAGHKLPTGTGVVGTAAVTGEPILATDVAQDPYWRPNPNLPDTKGELAVPIKLRDEILGILDVQSDRAGALTTEDQLVLLGLCGQIASAIQGARLLAQVQTTERQLAERLKELSCLHDIGRMGTEDLPIVEYLAMVAVRIPSAMQFPESCRVAIEFEGKVYGTATAMALPCQMTQTLRWGEEIGGKIYIAYAENHPFLDGESAMIGSIAERVSGYIQQRRLFAEIQARARREQRIREMTERVRMATDVDGIMQTAVQELRRTLGVTHVAIRLGSAEMLEGNGGEETSLLVTVEGKRGERQG